MATLEPPTDADAAPRRRRAVLALVVVVAAAVAVGSFVAFAHGPGHGTSESDWEAAARPCGETNDLIEAWEDQGMAVVKRRFPKVKALYRGHACMWDGGVGPHDVLLVLGPIAGAKGRLELYIAATVHLTGTADEPASTLVPFASAKVAGAALRRIVAGPDVSHLLAAGPVRCVAAAGNGGARIACRPTRLLPLKRLDDADVLAGTCDAGEGPGCVALTFP